MSWIKNLQIATKLIISFIIVAIIAGLVGTFGIISINRVNKQDTIMYQESTIHIGLVVELNT